MNWLERKEMWGYINGIVFSFSFIVIIGFILNNWFWAVYFGFFGNLLYLYSHKKVLEYKPKNLIEIERECY